MYQNIGVPYSGTFFLNKAVVTGVTGQTAKTFSATPEGTGAKMQYCIKGKAYSKAAISGGSLPTTDALTGAAFVPLTANTGCNVVLALDSGGNIKAAQGPVKALDSAGNFTGSPEFPVMPETLAAFAYIECKAGSTATSWVFGTGNWDATGITATPVDVIMLPARA